MKRIVITTLEGSFQRHFRICRRCGLRNTFGGPNTAVLPGRLRFGKYPLVIRRFWRWCFQWRLAPRGIAGRFRSHPGRFPLAPFRPTEKDPNYPLKDPWSGTTAWTCQRDRGLLLCTPAVRPPLNPLTADSVIKQVVDVWFRFGVKCLRILFETVVPVWPTLQIHSNYFSPYFQLYIIGSVPNFKVAIVVLFEEFGFPILEL